MALSLQFAAFLEGKECTILAAPCDVLFPRGDEADDEVTTVVQPDLLVVCDRKKLRERGCRGAPDLIIEIISPRTASRDQIRKRRLYEQHGVREYWLVHPTDRIVTVYRRGPDGAWGKPDLYDPEDPPIEVSVLPGLRIDFSTILPPMPHVVKESPCPAGSR